jgi:hypothetical protein
LATDETKPLLARERRNKSALRLLAFGGCLLLCAATLAAKGVMTWAAYWNYPVRQRLALRVERERQTD